MKTPRTLFQICLLAAAVSLAFMMPRVAMAHAILVSSTPSAHATVSGANVVVDIKFNSRIDAAHSRLYLVSPAGKVQVLKLVDQPVSPDKLSAQGVQLKSGAYIIRWQVLASDGHLTRGEIPFAVQ